jgi:hypothetical protein
MLEPGSEHMLLEKWLSLVNFRVTTKLQFIKTQYPGSDVK